MRTRELLRRYRRQLLYLFFGVCTTVVNVLVYGLCARLTPLSTAACTCLAWAAAVLLAYVTNRSWVFESRARSVSGVLRELGSFFLCRLATGGLDLAVMYVCVDRLSLPDIPVKAASNVLVIVLNYIASRLFIFAA